MSQLFSSRGQSIGASASASVLPKNIQGWLPLGLIGLTSLLPKGLSIQLWHPITTIQKNQHFLASSITRLSRPDLTTGKNIALTIWTFVSKVMSLLFNMLSGFVTAFLPRSKHLLISWLQSLSTVILEPKKIKSATVSSFSPSIYHEVMGLDVMILVFFECWFSSQLFHSPLSPSPRDFNSSSLSSIRLVSSASEVIDISPSNLDSSLCFQPSISHDVLRI